MDNMQLIHELQQISKMTSVSHYKRDVCAVAATTLSTLQGENEKLRAESIMHHNAADNYFAELTEYRQERNEAVAELELVKAERDAAVKDMELIVRIINDCNIKLDDGTTVSSLELGRCHVCKHEETGDCDDVGCIFEWRGPQKED